MAYPWDYLKEYSFNNIMARCLNAVSSDIDKRQGSIIYDALAPAIAELVQAYVEMQLFYINTHLETAVGDNLDYRCADFGLERIKRSYSERVAQTLDREGNITNIFIGSRYSTISEDNPLFYTCTGKLADGQFILTCETAGTIGNNYIGELLPTETNNNLGSIKISTIYKPGRDDETDEALRERTIEWLRTKPFGGNVAHYKLWCTEYDGIGQVQVYPTWNGGGTVKLSIIDPQNKPCSQEFIAQVKEYFDPEESSGNGLGIAPIGHKITIVTAEEKTVNIEFTSMLDTGVNVESIKEPCKKAIENYIEQIKNDWGKSDKLNQYNLSIYRAKIIAALINVEGILNVTQVKINGLEEDLFLQENRLKQELPVIGEVVAVAAT